MRKRVIAFTVILILIPFLGRAADSIAPKQKNLIMFNPAGLIFGIFNLEYERAISKKISMSLDGVYWSLSINDVDLQIYGGGVAPRFFISKQALNGLFLSPGVFLYSISAEDNQGNSESATGFSFPFLLGYTWIWGYETGFALSVGAGVSYNSLSALDVDVGRIRGVLRLAIGVAF